MSKENKTTNNSKPMAYDTLLATVGKHTYKLSDEPIKNGDWIYNANADKIDKCLMIYGNGFMAVEFDSGGRAVFSDKHYKKAIRQ